MLKLIAVGIAALSLAGCATVTRGTTNQIQIVSEPSGADVRTSMGMTCVAPCTITVSRKDEFAVTFNKPGYQELTIPVKTQVAGSGAAGFAGNVLLGGVVGMAADAATGATLEHVPNPVVGNLRPLGSQKPGKPGKPGKKQKIAPPPRAPEVMEEQPDVTPES